MRKSRNHEGKITEHSKGLGTITADLVEKRAREIAVINGRRADKYNEADRQAAKEELLGALDPAPPETDIAAAEIVRPWGDPGASRGKRALKQLPDDEQRVAEKLVEEGLEEAEHDRMLAARPRKGRAKKS